MFIIIIIIILLLILILSMFASGPKTINAEARLLQPPVQGSALAATAPKKQPILKPHQENPERLGASVFQKNKLQPGYLNNSQEFF